jgi:hypothetical protein
MLVGASVSAVVGSALVAAVVRCFATNSTAVLSWVLFLDTV